MSPPDRLGQVLVEVGIITSDQLAQAQEAMSLSGPSSGNLGDVLIRMGFATEAQMIKGIGMKDQIPYFEDLVPFLSDDSASYLSEKFCRQYNVVPLFREDGNLMLAMTNPYDLVAMDQTARQTALTVQPVVTTRAAIQAAIQKLHRGESEQSIDTTISQASREVEVAGAGAEEKEYTSFEVTAPGDAGPAAADVIDDAPVIRLVNQIMLGAINKRASDIHIEPRMDKVSVRYRLDGVLSEAMSIPKKLAPVIVSRIKIISKLDISEMRKPQDGRIRLKLSDRQVDLRVSTLPLVTGEKVVMRILDKEEKSQTIDKIGMPPDVLSRFQACINSPNGIILVTGPTGSGKTTTLYAALETIRDDSMNFSTLEDPVEYQINGINQISLNSAIGMTFATGLRSLLRQDPDVLLVGEIRDLETAKISIQAALTGHLVFSTLHTNNAPGAISRLLDMDIEPFLLTSALRGILAQRLVRLLCVYCRKSFVPDEQILSRLGLSPEAGPYEFFHPVGCDKCSKTGYRRRMGVFELLVIEKEIQDLILARASDTDILAAARKIGYRTMFENGIAKVLKGETSPEELLRVVLSN